MAAPLRVDVAVLGSGFGGSLTALLLQRIGLRPVLIDQGRHPRFAIGESSTPIADLILADLSRKYDLPRVAPLTKYGSWRADYPELRCGLKRGFSYFQHRPHERFVPAANHKNELLVAASSSDESADTHWFRADVDAFFAAEVQRENIPLLEETQVILIPADDGWELTGSGPDGPVRITAKFVIDATGEASVVAKTLGLASESHRLQTRSRALFAHFCGVRPWQEMLPAGAGDDYPFPCDQAALHHLLEEGWIWQLRFDSGIVSIGFAIDEAESPLDPDLPVDQEWTELLKRYPTIAEQLSKAEIVDPPGALRRTGRMQRLAQKIAGPTWALLPNAAGFIDPLHSTGIAQTLCGIERLIRILRDHWGKTSLRNALDRYESALVKELTLVDRIVAGGYASRRLFPAFAAFSMLYFAAATTYERRRQRGELLTEAAFLCADDPILTAIVSRTFERLRTLLDERRFDRDSVHAFERTTAEEIQPYNHAGLFDPSAENMYRYTALPDDAGG